MRKYVLLASVLLTGCATSPQDCDLQAQDPSFLTKLSCTTSGGYRQKVSEEEQKVQLSQWENQRAKQDLANTQNRQQATDQQLSNEQVRLQAARTDLARTMKRLTSDNVKSKASQKEIKQLQALQQQAQQATSASDVAAIEKKVADARKRVEALEQANTLQ
ncbi:hypothetical protein [Pantoea agglomerans]|uniref:Uncharacterized protein n=1 Tax=Enterobacter agglomerans TaxID=549 RepID=A0ACC5RLT6_ENTAG|nr:hypothetical protein [Pantoea agglomerans]MBK4725673.1 hypothetical protein [Pantoea agglomerans]